MIISSFLRTFSTILCSGVKQSGSSSISPTIRNMSSSRGYQTVQRGSLHNDDFRLYIQKDGKVISPFHDIPLRVDGNANLFNMVVEVPRWTNAKMEINLNEALNPIKQDVKKGKLRFVANVYPFVGYIWNYGALPQTWEDPNHVDKDTNCKGDGDPIDVCEIGQRIKERGEVVAVKILGVLAMVDEGETDWKLICIDNEDPLADKLNDIADVEKHMPGLLKDTVRWFRVYKMPDGKPANQFAFDGQPQNRDFALKVVEGVADQWKAMVEASASPEGISRTCTILENSSCKVSDADAQGLLSSAASGPDVPVSVENQKWHFVQE